MNRHKLDHTTHTTKRVCFSRSLGCWQHRAHVDVLLGAGNCRGTHEWLSCNRVARIGEGPSRNEPNRPPQLHCLAPSPSPSRGGSYFLAAQRPATESPPLPCRKATPPLPQLSCPEMPSSLLPATSGGLHVGPSPPRPRRRRCFQATATALPPTSGGFGRRAVSLAGVAAWVATTVGRADAASPLDKYVKRKKLEPLETYVPAVLLTIDQFVDLEKSLEFEKPRYDETRSLLRSGPASSLRINIRAVAQYASSNGQGKAASDAVDECLRALEDLDSMLLHASRNDPSASVETMRSKITVALGALDKILQTVPSAVLDKGKAIADAYRTPAEDYVEENAAELDPKLKQLEDIL